MALYQKKCQHRGRRGGFSFTEILFAVMILGIGFIMVAAVFPVAIKQTQETVEETTAADVAKGAASYLERIGTTADFPPTSGKVVAFNGYPSAATSTTPAFWQQVSGNLILSTDSRYAWIPFYSRNQVVNAAGAVTSAGLPYAQVTIIAVSCKNSTNFSNADLAVPDSNSTVNLQARPLTATITTAGPSSANPDTIAFTGNYTNSVAEGCYVVVADDSASVAANKLSSSASVDGYVYRVGAYISGTTWELMPGGDTKTATPGIHPAPAGVPIQVYVVGRGFNNPSGSSADTSLAGPAMDVAAYSTFIQIH